MKDRDHIEGNFAQREDIIKGIIFRLFPLRDCINFYKPDAEARLQYY